MLPLFLSLFGVLLLVSLIPTESADRDKFRTCADTAFCRRYRTWKDLKQRPIVSVTSIVGPSTNSPLDPYSIVELKLKSSEEDDANYGLKISLHRTQGIIRFEFSDISDSSVSGKHKRYVIPSGDVVAEPASLTSETRWTCTVTEGEVGGAGIVSVRMGDISRLEIHRSNFRVDVYNKHNMLVQVINSRNFFTFEKYRRKFGDRCLVGTKVDMACHDKIDSSGMWRDDFYGITDPKPYGPAAVGLDIELVNAVSLFGLPEKTVPFNLPVFREQTNDGFSQDDLAEDLFEEYRFYNSDVFAHELGSKMALYGSIPMVSAIHRKSPETASGTDAEPTAVVSSVLWLNPSDTFVALTRRSDARENIESTWVSETGVIDLFLFLGPTPYDAMDQFHYVTGLPALPPSFALGFHQSKWGYESQTEVEEINALFDKYRVPMDVMWLDIQHTDGNRYMTWNKTSYAEPAKLLANLSASGRKVVAIIDPHLKLDLEYSVYAEAFTSGTLVRFPDGQLFVGDCWPGDSTYIDFTRPDARAMWHGLLRYDKYAGSGSNLFVWNDMNEPSVFNGPEMSMHRSLVHGIDGEIEHREIHNLYGQYLHRSSFEGLLLRDGTEAKRPFVLSRSFFVGSHRYGPIWTGDNQATWEYMRVSVPMLASLAVSGMSFAGADVGGFEGHPDKDLFIRWHQLGSMIYPFYRCHSSIGSPRREPWRFDKQTLSLVRNAVQARYALLPYWYTLFGLHALLGVPIVRPLWYDHIDDPETYTNPIATEEQIMVGESLLVRGVFMPDSTEVEVYLPGTDCVWYDFADQSEKFLTGGHTITHRVSLRSIPVFVKGGSIIPFKLKKRASTLRMKDDPISLKIWLTQSEPQSASGTLYLDDEESMSYKDKEDFALILIDYNDGILSFARAGGNRSVKQIEIASVEIFGLRPLHSGRGQTQPSLEVERSVEVANIKGPILVDFHEVDAIVAYRISDEL